MTHQNSKYSAEQREFVRALWSDGLSAASMAQRFSNKFHTKTSRNAIIGLAKRMNLAPHDASNSTRANALAKRLATMRAKGVTTAPRPKKPVLALPEPPSEEPKPLGIDTGCQWLKGDDPKTWVFCGHPKFGVTPYCQHHFRRCYAPSHKPMVGSSRVDRQFR